jgi:hypothetical protein
VRELPAADPKQAMCKMAEMQKKSEPVAEILTSGESLSDENWELWHKFARSRHGRKADQGTSGNHSSNND